MHAENQLIPRDSHTSTCHCTSKENLCSLLVACYASSDIIFWTSSRNISLGLPHSVQTSTWKTCYARLQSPTNMLHSHDPKVIRYLRARSAGHRSCPSSWKSSHSGHLSSNWCTANRMYSLFSAVWDVWAVKVNYKLNDFHWRMPDPSTCPSSI